MSFWEERMKWHTGLHFNVFLMLAELKPRRTQSLYFELQLHGSWGLHNCSGVPLKLHTPKTLCGCNKSCIPLPPSLTCAVPSGEITLPRMFVTTGITYATCGRQMRAHTKTLLGKTTAATAAQTTKLSHSNHSSRAA